jgi:hypothetical protein
MNKKLDESVFSSYTQESCYWAGFLAADGCIDINNTVRIELGGKDKEHVQKFKDFCGSEHTISHNQTKNSYKVGFCSPAITSDLYYKYAVTINKTHELILPLLPQLEDYKHYLRGFYDGDGCITEFFNNRPTATYRVFLTSGTLAFLEELLELLKHNNITTGGSIQKKAANCWHIQLGVKDSAAFLNWIYTDATVYLPRKYDKYINLVVNNNRAKRDMAEA